MRGVTEPVRKVVGNETSGIGKYTGLWWFIKETPIYSTAEQSHRDDRDEALASRNRSQAAPGR
jgi:hypothetical protein